MTPALARTRALLDTPPPDPIPGQLDLETHMRSNHESTMQTTCDGGDGFCPEFILSSFFDHVTPEEQVTRHRKFVALEGWADHEGRDYCLDHIPAGIPTTP